MRRVVKWSAIVLAIVVLGAVALLGVSWAVTGKAMSRTYAVKDPPLRVDANAEALQRGKHLFDTRGCGDCHGPQGAGRVLLDDPALARIVPSNLTRSLRDPAYTDDALAAAIRHGVRPDGTPLLIMPSGEFADLDDRDVAALVAYMRALPASDNDPGTSTVRPLGRVLYTLGKLPLLPAETIDHTPRTRVAPAEAVTPEYGRYIAQSCTGCHGASLVGGIVVIPGKPASANLTPHDSALGQWSEADFLQLMHTGKRPDGTAVDPLMPWPAYNNMSETELRALWAYLRTVPPVQGAPVKR
ncbi:c-type cytochrome [Lysobacter solisilvae (ex Woo and Kim 2022)]|uniref:C-type cytochrome n=1 Tax=Agrilutibacter terrestris TaxID=2865112 RepID=A0A7H0FVD1_9GAMM|nr:c-type cytochrome [Lysobacter terrestris]QNP39997.1 c-type cytochrome [Lysobacter terrestris]